MTANTDNAGAIAATLSAHTIKALRNVMHKLDADTDALNSLLQKKLLGWTINGEKHTLVVTDLGKQVLAATLLPAASAPNAADGEDIDDDLLPTAWDVAEDASRIINDLRRQLADKEVECGRLFEVIRAAHNDLSGFTYTIENDPNASIDFNVMVLDSVLGMLYKAMSPHPAAALASEPVSTDAGGE